AMSSFLAASGSPCFDLDAIVRFVRGKRPNDPHVNPDGSLRVSKPDYPEWSNVTGYFGMGVEHFYPAAVADQKGLPKLSVGKLREVLARQRYGLLIFE